MKAINKCFEDEIFKELDAVWKTYYKHPTLSLGGGRKKREPKCIHIYGGERFKNFVTRTDNSNPLMDIICNVLEIDPLYYPIYSRSGVKKHYHRETFSEYNLRTFYNNCTRTREYKDNEVDFVYDYLIGGYPPILTRFFIERPRNKEGDLLTYYIKKRHANKKIVSSKTTNGGTESESIGTSGETD